MSAKPLPLLGALAAVGIVGALGGSLLTATAQSANAASADTVTAASTAATTTATTATTAADTDATDAPDTTPDTPRNPSLGGHVGSNGTKEVILIGDTAEKAKAAALAAVPGGTVQRVENDAEGATYEAHMTKSDGTQVTIKLDANFAVTGTESGFGGPGGR